MTPENGQNRPRDLRGVMTDSIIQVSEQSLVLSESITKSLRDGVAVNIDELIAAFQLNEQLSQAMKAFLESRGQVVFVDGVSVQTAEGAEGDHALGEEESVGPKTFGELLTSKIDGQLLDAEKSVFTRREIVNAAKNRQAVRKAAKEEGFPARKIKFSREEAVKIMHRVLTTPRNAFRRESQFLSRKEVLASFGMGMASLVDQFSAAISFDWKQTPSIDLQTALEIRGLIQLEKIISGQKTFRRGGDPANLRRASSVSN